MKCGVTGLLGFGGGSILAGLGADLLHHWEVPESSSPLITLNAVNVAQLNDRVAASADHMIQGTAGLQPSYNATGGPDSLPCIDLQDTGRIINATVSHASGNRLGLYVVFKASGSNVRTVISSLNGAATLAPCNFFRLNAEFGINTVFEGAADDFVLTVPAIDTNWHLLAVRPLATGALLQIDGATTTPDLSRSDGFIDFGIISIGHGTTAGGSVAAYLVVDNPTAAKDTIVKAYVTSTYGLTLA